MSRKLHKRDGQQTRERLAQLGLAADQGEPAEPCPDDSQFSALLEAEPGSAEQTLFFEHLSRCESCFQKWNALTDVLGKPVETRSRSITPRLRRRGLIGAVGSVFGLALGVMLYLNIDRRPSQYDAVDLSSGPAMVRLAPGPEPAAPYKSEEAGPVEQPPDGAYSGEAMGVAKNRAKVELPVPAEQEMADSAAAPGDGGAAGSVIPDLDDERAADSAPEDAQFEQMVRARTGFSPQEPAGQSIDLIGFIRSFSDLCTTHWATVPPEDSWRPILTAGRRLLGADRRWERGNREFVQESVRILEKETPIDDKEWGELCEQVRRLNPEQGGPHPRQ